MHLGHKNIIKYCNRPYSSVEEMDEDIIKKHNAVVSPNDTVYMIGDFAFRNHLDYAKRLNGNIILVIGSHDKMPMHIMKNNFHADKMMCIDINEYHIVLCHTCCRSWEKSHHGSWHLFGHHHGRLKTHNLSFDVGFDVWNKPISFDEVKVEMQKREIIMEQAGRIVPNERSNRFYLQDDVEYLLKYLKISDGDMSPNVV